MDNKFLELTSSPLMNLDHTYRYSGTKLVEAESLSQHIVDTIMMGLKIIDEINYRAGSMIISPANFLLKATYHDLEEAITGDVPRPLKYYDNDTLSAMRNVADKVAKSFFQSQFHSSDSAYDTWENAKEGKEGYVLKVVDTLVVANKVMKEVSLLNNYYMLRVAHEVSQYLESLAESFTSSVFGDYSADSYVEELIRDALSAMEGLLAEHKDIMDKFDIYGQSMI